MVYSWIDIDKMGGLHDQLLIISKVERITSQLLIQESQSHG
jgi:hypothetical protein